VNAKQRVKLIAIATKSGSMYLSTSFRCRIDTLLL